MDRRKFPLNSISIKLSLSSVTAGFLAAMLIGAVLVVSGGTMRIQSAAAIGIGNNNGTNIADLHLPALGGTLSIQPSDGSRGSGNNGDNGDNGGNGGNGSNGNNGDNNNNNGAGDVGNRHGRGNGGGGGGRNGPGGGNGGGDDGSGGIAVNNNNNSNGGQGQYCYTASITNPFTDKMRTVSVCFDNSADCEHAQQHDSDAKSGCSKST
jgi:hypothetical protein